MKGFFKYFTEPGNEGIVEAILKFEAMASSSTTPSSGSPNKQGAQGKRKSSFVDCCIVAADKVGDRYQRVLETMSLAGIEAERQKVEGSCGVWFARHRHRQGRGFLDAMIHHHQDVQKSKGRNGKQAWIDDGKRSLVRRRPWPLGTSRRRDQRVVHQYRIRP